MSENHSNTSKSSANQNREMGAANPISDFAARGTYLANLQDNGHASAYRACNGN